MANCVNVQIRYIFSVLFCLFSVLLVLFVPVCNNFMHDDKKARSDLSCVWTHNDALPDRENQKMWKL